MCCLLPSRSSVLARFLEKFYERDKNGQYVVVGWGWEVPLRFAESRRTRSDDDQWRECRQFAYQRNRYGCEAAREVREPRHDLLATPWEGASPQ